MNIVIQVQILSEAVYISHSANMLEKDMNLFILFTDMSK